jgi:hypothetical protein
VKGSGLLGDDPCAGGEGLGSAPRLGAGTLLGTRLGGSFPEPGSAASPASPVLGAGPCFTLPSLPAPQFDRRAHRTVH